MRTRLFSVAAVLGALGAAFCCLGPVIFSFLGVSAVVSLTTLSWVVPYRNAFFVITVLALALAVANVAVRRGRVSRLEWAMLGTSSAMVLAFFGYTISVEGLPRLW